MKWINYGQQLPQRWAFKRDIQDCWKHCAVKVQFLFECAWIVRDGNGRVYMPDGNWAATLDFYLRTPGHVAGLRDMNTANAHDWAHEWKAAMQQRIAESLAAKEQTQAL